MTIAIWDLLFVLFTIVTVTGLTCYIRAKHSV